MSGLILPGKSDRVVEKLTTVEIGDPKWVAGLMNLAPHRRDIHFDQRMVAPYITAYGWKASLAYTECENGYIIQPLLLTKENELRHAYNFGGPIGTNDLLNSKEHIDKINDWARHRDIKTQYCTLVPNLAKEQLRLLTSSGINPEFRKNSVIIDLEDQKIRGTTRRLANKAQGAGVEVRSYPLTFLKHFIDIYNATMDRVKAKDHWHFPDDWFEAFARFVKPCLMLAEFEGKFVAGCLIAYSQQYPVAYYHFAGCLDTYLGMGINQQMVLAACEFIRSIGLRYLYLGGGITDSEDDSLFIFKSGFSKLRQPVYSFKVSYLN